MITCENCRFNVEARMPGTITPQSVCTKSPPTAVMMQSPQGAALLGLQPPLPPAGRCGAGEPRSPQLDLPDLN